MMAFYPPLQEVILFGGEGASGSLNDTWAWDGSNWAPLTLSSNSPPARYQTGLAWDGDPANDNMVLFGGFSDSGQLNDTWTLSYDPYAGSSNWTEQFPTTTPSFRGGMGLAYDGDAQQMVLFGGNEYSCADPSCSSSVGNDTWTWDGTNWLERTPPTSPSARAFYTMTYDPAIAAIELFGGDDANNNTLGDTWQWDGTTWTNITPSSSAPAREYASADYNSTSNDVIMFGGLEANGVSNDTWDYAP